MTLNDGHTYRTRVRQGGPSVLEYLCAAFTHSPREVWAARLAAGEVDVAGVRAWGNEVLRAGQEVVWRRPPWPEPDVPLSFEVLHEDAALLAVNKPAGLPTLPAGGFLKHTLLTLVRAQFPGASPLHRLGRGTSGVVLFARTSQAGAAASREWREHAVGKTYRALASGVALQDESDIRVPIGPVPHARLGSVYAATPGGKAAHSHARVRERRREDTLFDVDITTGRPHQIRIHLAALGHPLRGDPLYGPGGFPREDALPGDLGYLLHAWRLRLTHPLTGEVLTVEAPVPPPLLIRSPSDS